MTRGHGDTGTRGKGDLATMRDRFLTVLTDVAAQVLRGKGEQRHGRGREFGEQPTFKILDLVGEGYAAGQAIKKIEEAKGLIAADLLGAAEGAERELLGAIGYLAMLVAWRRSRA